MKRLNDTYQCVICKEANARKIYIENRFPLTLCRKCLAHLANESRKLNSKEMEPKGVKGVKAVNTQSDINKKESSDKEKTLREHEILEFERNYQEQLEEFKRKNSLRKARKCSSCGVTYNDGVGCLCNRRW